MWHNLYLAVEAPLIREGDILVSDNPRLRNAIRREPAKWPDGVIPYVISSNFNTYERTIIANAIAQYHEKTCIQ